MRIVLIGSDEERARVRAQFGERGIEIVAEVATLAAARGYDADAFVLVSDGEGRGVETPLSPREREVIELMAEGLSNKSIAARLDIAEPTVKFHVASICGKLGADNRTDAVRRAVQRGLITL